MDFIWFCPLHEWYHLLGTSLLAWCMDQVNPISSLDRVLSCMQGAKSYEVHVMGLWGAKWFA
ncbi:hypothetical protein LguiA_012475 [Lonicera macranthoides]